MSFNFILSNEGLKMLRQIPKNTAVMVVLKNTIDIVETPILLRFSTNIDIVPHTMPASIAQRVPFTAFCIKNHLKIKITNRV
jgi:hypothetical protein